MGKRLSFDEQAFVADCASGFYTHRQLAERYGMSPHTAGKIARGQRRRGIARQVESHRRAARLRTERAVCERADRVVEMLDELMAGEDKRLAFAAAREILHHLIGRPAGVLELRAADRAAIEEGEPNSRTAAEAGADEEAKARARRLASPFRQAACAGMTREEEAEWEKEMAGDDEDGENREDGEDGEDGDDGQAAVDSRLGGADAGGGQAGSTMLAEMGPARRCASPGTSGTSAGAAAKPQVVASKAVTSNTASDVPVRKGSKTGTLRAHPQPGDEPGGEGPDAAPPTIAEVVDFWHKQGWTSDVSLKEVRDWLADGDALDFIDPSELLAALRATEGGRPVAPTPPPAGRDATADGAKAANGAKGAKAANGKKERRWKARKISTPRKPRKARNRAARIGAAGR